VVITEVILPIAFVVLLGFVFRRYGGRFEKAFSRTQLYILSPALLFSVMAGSKTGYALLLEVLLFVALVAAVLLAVTQGLGLAARSDRNERNAMSLAGVFPNAGFYGIPVCMLAFGEEGLKWASVYVAASATIQSTLGVFLASAGKRKISAGLLTVVKVPLIWAIVAGRVLADVDLLPPEPFMKMIDLLGRSAIPLGLLLLGMQLQRITSGEAAAAEAEEDEETAEKHVGEEGAAPDSSRSLVLGISAALVKILGGLAAGLVILRFFDLPPVLRGVMLIEASMPTAVNAVVYATEFDCRPRLVAIGILSSTSISVVSVTLILSYLV